MTAIYKREMLSYFTSPIGYVFIAVFLALNSFIFSLFTLMAGDELERRDLFHDSHVHIHNPRAAT